MFKRSTGQSLVLLVRELEPGRVNNLLRMLTGKLAESVQFFGGSVLIVFTRQIFVDVPTHLLTTFLTREHHRKHVIAPLKWGEQQRRPSRSSTADASEARDFRARSGSMSHHSHDISPRPIIEDNEDEQEHGHSKYDSKATSDDENPPTPPILNSTYPPQRLQTARTSISITNDAASNRSPSCSMALPPTVASRTITNTSPSRPSTDRASPASRPSALSSLDASTSFCCSCAALRPPLLTCTAPWSGQPRCQRALHSGCFPFKALPSSKRELICILLPGNLRPLLSPIALVYVSHFPRPCSMLSQRNLS